jgi:malonyl-ACP O-methyltransferase BioC
VHTIKKQIAKCFDSATSSYDEFAIIQKTSAYVIAKNLSRLFYYNTAPSTVLDVGSGTGYMAEELQKRFQSAEYTLNDISPKMISFLQKKFTVNSSFIMGDAEQIIFNHYDLIVSNFALQWCNDISKTIHNLYYKSDILGFSYLLDGTFAEWYNLIANYTNGSAIIPKYLSTCEIVEIIKSCNPYQFYYQTIDMPLRFATPLLMMQYLKKIGANASSNDIPLGLMKKLVKSTQQLNTTYKIFFAFIKREKK